MSIRREIHLKMAYPYDYRVLPCPSCGRTDSHTGSCEFSFMRTGTWWVFLAVPVGMDLEAQTTRDSGRPWRKPVS